MLIASALSMGGEVRASGDTPEYWPSREQPAALAASRPGADNSLVRRKRILIAAAVLGGVLMLAIFGFGMVTYGQASEAAMTSCGGVPSDLRKGATWQRSS